MPRSNPSPIPRRFPAQISDLWNHSMQGVFVTEIQFIFEFAGRLDRDRLARAVRLLLDAEPLFGCRFVPRPIKPYWERLPTPRLDAAPLLRVGDQDDLQDFLTEHLDEFRGPQLRTLLIPGDSGDRLVLKINHMIGDAGGIKQLAYRFADLYRRLETEPDLVPEPNLGSRDLKQLFRHYTWRDVWPMLRRYAHDNHRNTHPWPTLRFPASPDRSGTPMFVFHRLDADRVRRLRDYGAATGATLNDMLVAAMFRALIRQTGWKGGSTPRLMGTVDLRRHLPERRAAGVCNLSIFFFPHLVDGPGADFAETLARVKADIDAVNDKYFGSAFIYWATFGIRWVPFTVVRWIIQKLFGGMLHSQNATPVLTNLGPVDEKLLDFGAPDLTVAEIVVPQTLPPSLAVGFSGYRGTLTLSAGFVDSGFSRERLVELFETIDDELPR